MIFATSIRCYGKYNKRKECYLKSCSDDSTVAIILFENALSLKSLSIVGDNVFKAVLGAPLKMLFCEFSVPSDLFSFLSWAVDDFRHSIELIKDSGFWEVLENALSFAISCGKNDLVQTSFTITTFLWKYKKLEWNACSIHFFTLSYILFRIHQIKISYLKFCFLCNCCFNEIGSFFIFTRDTISWIWESLRTRPGVFIWNTKFAFSKSGLWTLFFSPSFLSTLKEVFKEVISSELHNTTSSVNCSPRLENDSGIFVNSFWIVSLFSDLLGIPILLLKIFFNAIPDFLSFSLHNNEFCEQITTFSFGSFFESDTSFLEQKRMLEN